MVATSDILIPFSSSRDNSNQHRNLNQKTPLSSCKNLFSLQRATYDLKRFLRNDTIGILD